MGAVALPLMILLALAKVRGRRANDATRVRLTAVRWSASPAWRCLMLWGFAGLPDFGDYRGPYGDILNAVSVPGAATSPMW